jgi:hypothetical protein
MSISAEIEANDSLTIKTTNVGKHQHNGKNPTFTNNSSNNNSNEFSLKQYSIASIPNKTSSKALVVVEVSPQSLQIDTNHSNYDSNASHATTTTTTAASSSSPSSSSPVSSTHSDISTCSINVQTNSKSKSVIHSNENSSSSRQKLKIDESSLSSSSPSSNNSNSIQGGNETNVLNGICNYNNNDNKSSSNNNKINNHAQSKLVQMLQFKENTALDERQDHLSTNVAATAILTEAMTAKAKVDAMNGDNVVNLNGDNESIRKVSYIGFFLGSTLLLC